jgi:tRNA A37 threonylcarbamoyladenosine biosynthesis protein TsaE
MAGLPEVSLVDWFAEYPPLRSLPLDQEALRIYEHAYYVGLKTEAEGDPPVSFTTVIAALLVGEDETSSWFARQAAKSGPNAADVYAEKKIDEETVKGVARPSGKPNQVKLAKDKHLLTPSARAVIENAERWAQRVGGSDIGVRHLVASYVLNPPAAHRAQMQRWKFQEAKWRSEFFEWVAKRYTAEQWADASRGVAPTKAVPAFEQQKVKGAALAFPGDQGTIAVLEKAAKYHARRNDKWLRLQTVFYALVETGRDNDTVREAILPIWAAVEVVKEQYRRAHDEFFSSSTEPEGAAPFSALDISPRVLNALETARELEVATRRDINGEFSVGVLHLAGAIVSRRVDGDVELSALGLNPQDLRIELIKHAHQRAESSEIWREALGEEESLQAGRPVDLNSDDPEAVVRLDEDWTSDPLSIRRDVESFAALLASKSLEPPLSIGLFGPWGSGKTTFLKRLRRAVERRADEARTAIDASQPTAYVSNVVHVDFNAWHFAEEALTSSLVDTILRQLSAYIKDDEKVAGIEWREQKRAALESTKRKVAAATAVQEAAQTAVTKAETALVETRKLAAEQASSYQAVVQGVWTITKEELQKSPVVKDSGILEAVGDAIKSAGELDARLKAVTTRPARILSDLGWPRTLLFAALVLAVPPVFAWAVGKELGIGQIGQLLSSVTAIASVIGLWARAATGAVSKVDQAITEVANAYAERIANNQGVVDAQANLDAAQARAATAAAGLQAAREELARTQTEVANASLPAQMLQLVSRRIEDQSYNKELTTLSLARADLEALSVILRDQLNYAMPASNTGAPPGETSSVESARAVDRVILYIDDLDRCKPQDVVRVLQMVHMLLAFELFVVVVAVDARWVEDALMQSYRWLASSNADASDDSSEGGGARSQRAIAVTPQDYLEKIFQISFWLEPMTSARAASYLASLVRAPARESGPVLGSGVAVEPSKVAGSAVPVTGKIEIAGIELDYMRALAAYVGPSPRRVKRLVNAYRLIKARMSDAQLSTFLTDRATEDGDLRSGPYQIVIGLLVIGTGAPSSSAQILKELAECDPRDGLEKVVDQFRSRNHPDWTMAAQVIETIMQTQKAKDVSELRGWARKVGRFLLNGPAANLRLGGTPLAVVTPQAEAGLGSLALNDGKPR